MGNKINITIIGKSVNHSLIKKSEIYAKSISKWRQPLLIALLLVIGISLCKTNKLFD